jgi:protein-S-isoprenylcysteine O-methyltransferase Ste14
LNLSALFLLVVAPVLAILLALLGLETLDDNLMGWTLLGLGAVVPGGIVIDYHARRGAYRRSDRAGERSGLSFWLILPGLLTALFAPPLEWMYAAPWLPRAPACQVRGVGLFFGSLALVTWARASLRRAFTPSLAVRPGQILVETGPYRYVRHPAYLGQLLMALSVAVGYSSLIGLVAVLIGLFPAMAHCVRVEEQPLAARFGEAYAAYSRRARRLIPGLW